MKNNNKKHVLKKNWEFQNVIGNKGSKNKIINSYLIFYYKPNNEHLRIGISVSKRFAIAVKRNFYRRQVREMVRSYDDFSKKFDVVIILRKNFLSLSFEDKDKKIKEMMGKL